MGGQTSRVSSLGKDAQCKCHSESVATLSGKHVVEGADGSILEGTWEPEGQLNSNGKWQCGGNSYEGEFTDGHFNGSGTLIWSSGERFHGKFEMDCPGEGTLFQKVEGKEQIFRVTYESQTIFGSKAPHDFLAFDQLGDPVSKDLVEDSGELRELRKQLGLQVSRISLRSAAPAFLGNNRSLAGSVNPLTSIRVGGAVAVVSVLVAGIVSVYASQ